MLHDSVLGVELLLRYFQNIFAWLKWKNLDSFSCVNRLDEFMMKWWNLDKLFMCVWNDEIWTDCLCEQIWTIWTDWTNFWIDWTGFWTDFMCEQVEQIFLMKFLWNLNRFCCYFLNRFYVWTCWIDFLWSFYEIQTNFVAVFWTDYMCAQVE